MGARTKLVKRGQSTEDFAKELRDEFFGGEGPEVTIECSGAETSIITAIHATKKAIIQNHIRY
jgi:threonine dehydrogenase-like Zn-dependent dehydrogenase